MIQCGDSVSFALEPLIESFGRELDGYGSIQARITSFINLAHAAYTS
jgi:hypothetical protein